MIQLSRRALLGGALATAGLAPFPARAAPLAKVIANGVLRVAVYRDFAPWSWRRDGEVVGIDVELGHALAKAIGVRAEIIDFMADESADDDLRNMVWRGPLIGGSAADVMMHAPYDRVFAKANDRVAIVAPYYREGFAMACDRDTDCEVPPPQLKGKRLITELDSIPDFYFSGSFGGVLRGDVEHELTALAAIDKVKAKQADAVLATRAQIEHAMSLPDAKDLKLRRGPLPALPSPGWDVAMAVKDDSRDLGDKLDEIITAFRGDGTLAAIFARYGVAMKPPLAG